MPFRFLRLIKRVNAARTLDELNPIFFRMRDDYGFNDLSYLVVQTKGKSHSERFPLFIATHDRRWQRRYFEKNYFNVDPILQQGMRSFRPIDWSSIQGISAAATAFLEDARRHGVGHNGMTLPIAAGESGERALLSFSSNHGERMWHRLKLLYARDLLYFGHTLHDRAMDLATQKGVGFAPTVHLGETDRRYLKAIREGKVPKQIAAENKTTIKTVSVHLARARLTLNASTNADAIIKAIEMNLL